MLSECKTHIRLENSVIKGYHDYKIRPPNTDPVTRLLVDKEYTNIHDICACLVWIPPLSTFPQCQHEILTDEKRHLLLKDVADLPVGHVPRELAGCFRAILDMGDVFFVNQQVILCQVSLLGLHHMRKVVEL